MGRGVQEATLIQKKGKETSLSASKGRLQKAGQVTQREASPRRNPMVVTLRKYEETDPPGICELP